MATSLFKASIFIFIRLIYAMFVCEQVICPSHRLIHFHGIEKYTFRVRGQAHLPLCPETVEAGGLTSFRA